MRGRRTAHAARAGVRAVRALVALLVLLALGVGIPVLLLALTPTSFPQGVPGPGEVLRALTQRDDGTILLAALALTAWVGWATFAVAVLLELPAQLRGVPAVRVPGLGVQQSVAGGLVASVLAAVLVPGAAVAAARESPAGPAPTGGDPAASASAVPGVAAPPDAAGPAAHAPIARSAGLPSGPVHVVAPGDTLWDLAAQHLGDGSQWRRIAALNYDRSQPDGGQLDRSHTLRPGWRLELPAEPPPRQEATGPREHVVVAGETLSGIAQQELGDAARYPELARATEGIRQPDGARLEDADLIRPGWRVQVPAERVASAGPAGPAGPAPPEVPDDSPSVDRTVEPGVDPLDPSWGHPPPAASPPEPAPPGRTGPAEILPFGGRTGAPAHAVSTQAPERGDVDEDDDTVADVRTAAGAGALLAASLMVLLRARRSRQQRRRRPGERIPLPAAGAAATEALLRAVADPPGNAHVDLALRALAAAHRRTGRPLPGLRVARLTASHLELYLTEPARFPGPWVPTSDPTVWALPADEVRSQPEVDLRAPYPALVTLGHDLEGAHVLVDLEQVTELGLEGPPARTLPVLAALAVELGTSPWADDLLVTLVGCLPELPGALGTGRLRHVESVERLLADLEGRARDVERVLREAGVHDLAAARGAGVADDAWSPEIVLMAGEVPPALRARLDDVLYRLPRVGVAVVTGAGGSTSWQLRVAGDDTARLDPVGITLRPQRLAGAEYEHVVDLLRLADAEPVPGPAAFAALPATEPALGDLPHPAPDRGGDALPPPSAAADGVVPPARRVPAVHLLGPVSVVGACGPEPVVIRDGRAVANHLGRATALVAFLACATQGATTEQVAAALSPVRRLSPATIWSLASRTRKWLGSDADGVPYYPRTPDAGAHRLHPAVRTDWSRWVELVGDDVSAAPTDRLTEALALVRGRPFEGVTEKHYTWAEPLRQEMTAAVVDVAHEVARRALLDGDPATARRAARTGRTVDPVNELLWRDGLRAEYLAGNREARRRLVEQLYALADELEVDLEPETERLIAELDGRVPAPAAR